MLTASSREIDAEIFRLLTGQDVVMRWCEYDQESGRWEDHEWFMGPQPDGMVWQHRPSDEELERDGYYKRHPCFKNSGPAFPLHKSNHPFHTHRGEYEPISFYTSDHNAFTPQEEEMLKVGSLHLIRQKRGDGQPFYEAHLALYRSEQILWGQGADTLLARCECFLKWKKEP